MDAAKVIVDNRVNGLGVSEPLVQRQGENRIIVELPGIDDPNQAIATLRGTGLLEFVEMGQEPRRTGRARSRPTTAEAALPLQRCGVRKRWPCSIQPPMSLSAPS